MLLTRWNPARRTNQRAPSSTAQTCQHIAARVHQTPPKQSRNGSTIGLRSSRRRLPGWLQLTWQAGSVRSRSQIDAAAAAAAAAAAGAGSMADAPDAAAATVAGDAEPQEGWSHAMMAYYLAADRNWKAVEDFYIRLVSGSACLTQIGLAPAGAAAAETFPAAAAAETFPATAASATAPALVNASGAAAAAAATAAVPGGPHADSRQEASCSQGDDHQQQQQQQQQRVQQQHNERKTYKVHVSYLGSSFAGWARQPGRQSVEETLAAAVAAAGLTGESADDTNAKRAAARAARRAQKKAKLTGGDVTPGTPAATATAMPNNGQESTPYTAADHSEASGDLGLATAALAAPAAGLGSLLLNNNEPQAGADSSVSAAAAAAAAAALGPPGAAARLPTIQVAGRTDAGVTAAGQVISFHSRLPPLDPAELLQRFNTALATVMQAQAAVLQGSSTGNPQDSIQAANSSNTGQFCAQQDVPTLPVGSQIRAWAASEEPRQFHATFSATWRRYVYLLPLKQQLKQEGQQHLGTQSGAAVNPGQAPAQLLPQYSTEIQQALHENVHILQPAQLAAVQQAADIDPGRVNALLQHLQGRKLDYYSYARDTPKGKDCECVLHVARAFVVHIPAYHTLDEEGTQSVESEQEPAANARQPCLCIELVGNRFLRRMVRVLVASAVRESLLEAAAVKQSASTTAEGLAAGEAVQPLVDLAALSDRTKTAAASPGLGLCFVAVGYDESYE